MFKSEDADQDRNAPSATEQSGEIALLTAARTHNDTNRFKPEDADQGRNAPSVTEQSGEIALLTAARTYNAPSRV